MKWITWLLFAAAQGAVKGKKKRKRLEDMVDFGLGYDENDPFVDNSECVSQGSDFVMYKRKTASSVLKISHCWKA